MLGGCCAVLLGACTYARMAQHGLAWSEGSLRSSAAALPSYVALDIFLAATPAAWFRKCAKQQTQVSGTCGGLVSRSHTAHSWVLLANREVYKTLQSKATHLGRPESSWCVFLDDLFRWFGPVSPTQEQARRGCWGQARKWFCKWLLDGWGG